MKLFKVQTKKNRTFYYIINGVIHTSKVKPTDNIQSDTYVATKQLLAVLGNTNN